MIDKERFHELMELICDNCLALQLNEESADDDPADWHDFCVDCFIEAAVHDAIDAAEREGVTFACCKMLSVLESERKRYSPKDLKIFARMRRKSGG